MKAEYLNERVSVEELVRDGWEVLPESIGSLAILKRGDQRVLYDLVRSTMQMKYEVGSISVVTETKGGNEYGIKKIKAD